MYGPEVQQSMFEQGYMKGYADALAETPPADDTLEQIAARVVALIDDRKRAEKLEADRRQVEMDRRVWMYLGDA